MQCHAMQPVCSAHLLPSRLVCAFSHVLYMHTYSLACLLACSLAHSLWVQDPARFMQKLITVVAELEPLTRSAQPNMKIVPVSARSSSSILRSNSTCSFQTCVSSIAQYQVLLAASLVGSCHLPLSDALEANLLCQSHGAGGLGGLVG